MEMKVSELKKILDQYPDDAEIAYEDRNYGGWGKDIEPNDIYKEENGLWVDNGTLILISVPYFAEID